MDAAETKLVTISHSDVARLGGGNSVTVSLNLVVRLDGNEIEDAQELLRPVVEMVRHSVQRQIDEALAEQTDDGMDIEIVQLFAGKPVAGTTLPESY